MLRLRTMGLGLDLYQFTLWHVDGYRGSHLRPRTADRASVGKEAREYDAA